MNPLYEYRNITWRETTFDLSGSVLVSMKGIRESRLDLYNYEGSKLPACRIYAVLKVALAEGWVQTMEELHRRRKNQWKTDIFVNPKGEKEYRLYKTKQNKTVCSSIIATSNNQIHSFSIMSEDAAPLLRKIIEDYPPAFLPRSRSFYYLDAQTMKFFTLPEVIMDQRERTKRFSADKDGNDFCLSGAFQPGETSNIIETIEALKCLEVLQA